MPNKLLRIHRYLPVLMLGVLLSVPGIRAEEPQTAKGVPANPEASASTPPSVPAASQATTPDELKTALRPRVERYWSARQARDVKTVYEMESASRPGGGLKLENAMSLQGLPVRKVKIGEIKIEGERGEVQVSADVLIGTLGWVPQTTIQDHWILLEGQWYHETAKNF